MALQETAESVGLADAVAVAVADGFGVLSVASVADGVGTDVVVDVGVFVGCSKIVGSGTEPCVGNVAVGLACVPMVGNAAASCLCGPPWRQAQSSRLAATSQNKDFIFRLKFSDFPALYQTLRRLGRPPLCDLSFSRRLATCLPRRAFLDFRAINVFLLLRKRTIGLLFLMSRTV